MKQNIQELRDGLIRLFHNIESGKIKPPVACEMNNAAGKALSACKLEIEYIRMKEKTKGLHIQFMEANGAD